MDNINVNETKETETNDKKPSLFDTRELGLIVFMLITLPCFVIGFALSNWLIGLSAGIAVGVIAGIIVSVFRKK